MTRKQRLLFAIVMSLGMTFIMSFVMAALNVGFVEHFAFIWLKAFGVGFLVALPATMLVAPLSQHVVRAVLPSPV
ncbi:MAG: DUF2798 domain-containing protein [Proteobacteria bacterium]|nr:DUF2798 domain-containing protein [Pseudomonadota bacterium]MCP4918548.1 DUF2798 domain-containing protein [Pseudomonadota bacterium]